MPVVSLEKCGIVRCDRIDPFVCRQLRRSPVLLVPIPAEHPLTLLQFFGLCGDSANELLSSSRICELHLIELKAAADEMQVSIVEAGQKQLPCCVDDASLRPAPCVHLRGGAHR